MRHRHPGRPSILLVAVAAVVLAGTAPASAEVTIAVSPALLELDGRAGGRGHVEITLSNNGDEDFEVVTAIAPLLDLDDERSAVQWMSLEPDRIRLGPGEDRVARLTLAIPDDVDSGGRYAAAAFTTVAPGVDESTAVSGRILVPVLLTVTGRGDLTRLPDIERAALFLEGDGSIGARVEVSNDGNTHVPLTGDVRIALPSPSPSPGPDAPAPSVSTTVRGEDTLARLAIPMGRVLPGATRIYAGDSTLWLPLGDAYEVTVTLGVPPDQDALPVQDLRERFSVEATPTLTLGTPALCLDPRHGPSVTATLGDTGSLGLVATVMFAIVDETGAQVAGAGATREVVAWPSQVTEVTADLTDPLPDGLYTLVASAAIGTGDRVEAELPFSVGADPATGAPPCVPAATPPPAS